MCAAPVATVARITPRHVYAMAAVVAKSIAPPANAREATATKRIATTKSARVERARDLAMAWIATVKIAKTVCV